MRILYSNSSRNWGGNEFWCKNSINALAKRGHKISIAVRSDIFDGKLDPSVDIIKLPFKHELDGKTIKPLKKFIIDNDIDILLPTKRKEYFVLGRIGKKLKRKVVFRLGIMRSVSMLDLPQRYVYNYLPDAIIVNAQKIKDVLLANRLSDREKINVIHNGYNFPELKLSGLGFEPDKSRYIFSAAGRLGPQKGIDLILSAAVILKNNVENFVIYIAGEGSSRKDYEDYIRTNNLHGHIKLIGHIDNVRELFYHSDCILIPSRNEGIPNALFEAWSLKKTVISSNAAGLPEAIKDYENGLMVDLDAKELANAMGYVMRFSDFSNEMGEFGYITMKEKFSLEAMVLKLEALFERLLK